MQMTNVKLNEVFLTQKCRTSIKPFGFYFVRVNVNVIEKVLNSLFKKKIVSSNINAKFIKSLKCCFIRWGTKFSFCFSFHFISNDRK